MLHQILVALSFGFIGWFNLKTKAKNVTQFDVIRLLRCAASSDRTEPRLRISGVGGSASWPTGKRSHEDVDEKVDGGVEGDEKVRHVLNDQDPVGPVVVRETVVAVAGLEGRRDQLPDVAADEEPDDEDGNPGESPLLVAVVAAVVDDARATRDAAASAPGSPAAASSARAWGLERRSDEKLTLLVYPFSIW